ncbi:putative transcriptional regulator [Agrobacterium vitis]|nr:putative transcriptional regulator [Agrobacterium vitis]MBE1439845.1 putative transcriptional regulator [Agrobacterium vitis]
MSKYIVAGLAVLAAIASIVWGAVAAITKIDDMVTAATAMARNERDAYWRAEIEKSNADAQAKIAANLKATMAAQDAARDQIAATERRATELEKENAALPDDGACGLSLDSVRLLNKR